MRLRSVTNGPVTLDVTEYSDEGEALAYRGTITLEGVGASPVHGGQADGADCVIADVAVRVGLDAFAREADPEEGTAATVVALLVLQAARETAARVGRADYDERRHRRIEGLWLRAAKRREEGEGRLESARRTAAIIPLGQPILVGHHSEKRHRRDLDRIDAGHRKGFEALKDAEQLASRAASAEENHAISSDDPEALERLRQKLDGVRATHKRWKDVIGALGKLDRAKEPAKRLRAQLEIDRLTLTDTERRTIELSRGFGGEGKVHLGYKLTNSNKEIKRLEGRIALIEARAVAPEKEAEKIGGCVIREADNRVQLRFPGKPSPETLRVLKSSGFRWSPREGAWQRFPSEAAWRAAREIATKASEVAHG